MFIVAVRDILWKKRKDIKKFGELICLTFLIGSSISCTKMEDGVLSPLSQSTTTTIPISTTPTTTTTTVPTSGDSPLDNSMFLTLFSPSSSPSFTTTPTIKVSNVTIGNLISLHANDSSCSSSSQKGSGYATGSQIEITFSSALTSDGSYEIYSKSSNNKGNFICSTSYLTYALDRSAPTLPSVSINNGDSTTQSTSANLSLSATDTPYEMYVTNTAGCGSGGTWETFNATKTWTLGQTNSTATVYVRFRDIALNESNCVSDNITHQNTVPSAPSAIELAVGLTSPSSNASPSIKVSGVNAGDTISIYDDISCLIGNKKGTSLATGSTVTLTVSSSLATDGSYSFYARASNVVGDSLCIGPVNYTLDRDPPTLPTVTIESGATSTKNSSINLTLSATGAAEMYITNTAGCGSGGAWEAFNTAKTWTLGQANTTATVYAKFRDVARNETGCVNDTIIHDSIAPAAPTLSLSSPSTNRSSVTTPTFTVNNVTANDAISLHISSCSSAAVANGAAAGTSVNLTSSALSISSSDTNYTFYAKATDSAGNFTCSAAGSVYTTNNTLPSISINSGDAYSKNATVTLNLTPSSGSTSMYITNTAGCASGGTDESVATTKSWTLGQTNGVATVYVKFTGGSDTSCISDTIIHDDIVPSPPQGLSLTGLSSSPSSNATPTIRVFAGTFVAGDTISIHTDNICSETEKKATGILASGTSIDLVSSALSSDGDYIFYGKVTDSAGNGSSCSALSSVFLNYTLDRAPPGSPSLTIENGNNYTQNSSVSLSLSATGSPYEMYITNTAGCGSGGSWESFNTTKTWTLGQTNSTAIVYAKFRDTALNESSCTSDSITHDNTAPPLPSSLSLLVPTSSPSSNVTPTIRVNGVTSGHTISLHTDSNCASVTSRASSIATSTSIDLTVSAFSSDGTYSFYAKATNPSGISVCSTANLSYTLDRSAPSLASISINNGASYTNNTSVTLTLSAIGSPTEFYVTDVPGCTSGGSWQSMTTNPFSKSWTLAQANTTSSVYVRFRNAALNESSCVNDSIIHDNVAPAVPTFVTLVTPVTTPSTPTIRVIGAEVGSIVSLHTDNSCSTTQQGIGVSTSVSFDLSASKISADGSYTYYAKSTDMAGNYSCSTASYTYVLDTTPPSSPSVVINSGAAYTNSSTVALTLSASGSPSEMYITTTSGCGSGGAWEAYTTSRSYSFIENPGMTAMIVYAKFRDGSGNESACAGDSISYETLSPSAPSNLSVGSIPDSFVQTPTLSWTTDSTDSGGSNVSSYKVRVLRNSDSVVMTSGWVDFTKGNSISGLTLDSYTDYYFQVKAIDGAGNESSSVNSAVWWTKIPTISIANKSDGSRSAVIMENVGTTITFTITSDLPVPSTGLVVPYVVSGEAVNSSDHNLSSGSATISAGQTSVDVSFNLVDDTSSEYDERIRIDLDTARNARLSTYYYQMDYLIRDNDVTISGTYSATALGEGANPQHHCAITSGGGQSGILKCWGNNNYGQLGDGTQINSGIPKTVFSGGVTSVSQGDEYTCAVVSNAVKCWGRGDSGQLGNTASSNSTSVVQVTGLTTNASMVSVGSSHSCAVVNNGAWCWGYNGYGNLGDNTTVAKNYPVQVSGLTTGVSAIAVGGPPYTCAIVNSGVKCWGYNPYGNLGTNNTSNYYTPQDVSGLTSGSGVTAISIGDYTTCAVVNGGLKCWGYNNYGQIGDGTTNNYYTPKQIIVDNSGVTAVSVGYYYTCAVVNGGLMCWGYNNYGQFGDGTTTNIYLPKVIYPSGSGVTAVTTGQMHTCAIVSGAIKCWGRYDYGQLGVERGTYYKSPQDTFPASSGVTSISGASDGYCVVVNGAVKCWGYNDGSFRLGDFSSVTRSSPVTAYGLTSGATAVSGGGSFSCAIVSGAAKCWGTNGNGELGDGTNTNKDRPVQVSGLTSGVTQLTSGWNHSCALLTGGVVKCWGYNGQGQLGVGNTTSYNTPQTVTIGGVTNGISSIVANGHHTCALLNNRIYCWGENDNGELGTGNTVYYYTPQDLFIGNTTISVSKIFLGPNHTCAIIDNALKCWGYNGNGQLGVGNTTSYNTPQTVLTNPCGVTEMALSNEHTCALIFGQLKCWGYNGYSQLGDNTTTGATTPTVSSALTGMTVTALSVNKNNQSTCAIVNGGVKCWGDNIASGGYFRLGLKERVANGMQNYWPMFVYPLQP